MGLPGIVHTDGENVETFKQSHYGDASCLGYSQLWLKSRKENRYINLGNLSKTAIELHNRYKKFKAQIAWRMKVALDRNKDALNSSQMKEQIIHYYQSIIPDMKTDEEKATLKGTLAELIKEKNIASHKLAEATREVNFEQTLSEMGFETNKKQRLRLQKDIALTAMNAGVDIYESASIELAINKTELAGMASHIKQNNHILVILPGHACAIAYPSKYALFNKSEFIDYMDPNYGIFKVKVNHCESVFFPAFNEYVTLNQNQKERGKSGYHRHKRPSNKRSAMYSSMNVIKKYQKKSVECY